MVREDRLRPPPSIMPSMEEIRTSLNRSSVDLKILRKKGLVLKVKSGLTPYYYYLWANPLNHLSLCILHEVGGRYRAYALCGPREIHGRPVVIEVDVETGKITKCPVEYEVGLMEYFDKRRAARKEAQNLQSKKDKEKESVFLLCQS